MGKISVLPAWLADKRPVGGAVSQSFLAEVGECGARSGRACVPSSNGREIFISKGGLKIIMSHSGMSSVRKSASIVSSVFGYLKLTSRQKKRVRKVKQFAPVTESFDARRGNN